MKTLYVSDLDGTLLNINEELNTSTIDKLNQLIDNGINFTVSTGRGPSVKDILKDVKMKFPALILNGATNYDFDKKQYVDRRELPNKKAIEVVNSVNNFGFISFQIQTIIDNELKRCSASDWDRKSECLAFNILHKNIEMHDLGKILETIDGINFFIHKKVYSNDEWFCDISLENVSKASSLKLFKENYSFEKIIAFGDSENDLPLAEVADEFYAVSNAAEIVKKNATAVIGSCYEDGVVNFIAKCEKFSFHS